MAEFEKFDNTVIQAKEFDVPTGKVTVQRFKLTPLHGVLMVFALIVLCFIGFITLAKSVQINAVAVDLAQPSKRVTQQASISIKSALKLPIGNRVLVLPGSYKVVVSAKGFQPLKQQLEISDQRHQQKPSLETPNLLVNLYLTYQVNELSKAQFVDDADH